MILVGWRGFARRKLSTEQVVNYALEQIGKGTPEQDEVAALLANTDPSEWQTVDRHLEQLAGMQKFDRQVALRKWRLVELKALIGDVLPINDEADEEEHYSTFFSFADLWRDYDELPDSSLAMPAWKAPITETELVYQQQAWATQEEALLREQSAASKLKHSVMEFHGVGRDALGGLDVQQYINEMRDEWDRE